VNVRNDLAKSLDQLLLIIRLRYEGSVAKLFWNVFALGTGQKHKRYLSEPEQHCNLERLAVCDLNVQKRQIDRLVDQLFGPSD
jgi:hypothetical protein